MVSSPLICVVHFKTILETSAALFHPSLLLRLHALHNLSLQPRDPHFDLQQPHQYVGIYMSLAEQEPVKDAVESLIAKSE
jgi:hypothetical protein